MFKTHCSLLFNLVASSHDFHVQYFFDCQWNLQDNSTTVQVCDGEESAKVIRSTKSEIPEVLHLPGSVSNFFHFYGDLSKHKADHSSLVWPQIPSDTWKGGQKHTYVSHVRMKPRNPDAILTTMLTSLRFFTGMGPMQQKQVENIHMYAYLCTLLSWGFKYICY